MAIFQLLKKKQNSMTHSLYFKTLYNFYCMIETVAAVTLLIIFFKTAGVQIGSLEYVYYLKKPYGFNTHGI